MKYNRLKSAAVLASVVLGGMSLPAYASQVPTIAILDTSINYAQFPNVIHEVCETASGTCPNGQGFMEGTGAANVPASHWADRGMDHGSSVVATAVKTNPNVRIVFVRIADTFSTATTSSMLTEAPSLDNAIAWVAKNFKQYGIGAVSLSQEAMFSAGTCRVDANLTASVETLKAGNVPVLAGVGNSGLQNHTAWPACSPDVIGVGATSAQGNPLYFSNLGQGVQLMAQGSLTVPMPKGPTGTATTPILEAGTSIATPVAATLWATNFSGTWANQVAQMQKLPQIQDSLKNKYWWIK
jgi:hypothetical protein